MYLKLISNYIIQINNKFEKGFDITLFFEELFIK